MSCCSLPQQYSPSPESRERLAIVAVGPKNIPSEFFSSLASSESPMISEPPVPSATYEEGEQGRVTVTDDGIPVLDTIELVSATVYVQGCEFGATGAVINGSNPDTSSINGITEPIPETVRSEFFKSLNLVFDQFGDNSTTQALLKATQRVKSIRNANTLNSFLFTFGSSLGVKGGKIPCQPSSVSRRSEGMSRGRGTVGKGRRPKGAPEQREKRKRNLAENIRANQAIAKSH